MSAEEVKIANSKETALEVAHEAVDKLYEFRDHYFEHFSLDQAVHKDENVEKKMHECLEKLTSLKDNIPSKATYSMLRGRALNVLPVYNKEAESLLSKAVKLDPKLVDGWNHLGECYWKNKDVTSAKNCFIGALNHSKNKVSLRNLSMVLRQLPTKDAFEKADIVRESVEKAKEAVEMDIADGNSWAILGNAYLSLFFAAGQNPRALKQAMSAYALAERDPVSRNNSDLHFNQAIAYKYQEEYQKALEGFSKAMALDAGWMEPQEQEMRLMDYLSRLTTLQSSQGKMKAKKLQNLCKSIIDNDLGPYSGGSYTNQRNETITLNKKKLKDLKSGVNLETVVVGKVVCTVANDESIPFTFCFIDEEGLCLSVTVYNIGQGYGVKIGDSVAIPEPFVQDVEVNYKDKVFSYRGIRVDTPVVLVVNRRKLGLDKQAPTVLALSTLTD